MEEWVEIFNPNSTIVKFYGSDKIMYIYNNYLIGYDLVNKRRFYSLDLDEFEELKDRIVDNFYLTKTKAIIQTSGYFSQFMIDLELKNIIELEFKFKDLSFEKDYILLQKKHIIKPDGEIITINKGSYFYYDNFNNIEEELNINFVFFNNYIYNILNNTIHKYSTKNINFNNGKLIKFSKIVDEDQNETDLTKVIIDKKIYTFKNFKAYYKAYYTEFIYNNVIYLENKNILYLYYNKNLFIYNLDQEKLLYHFEFENSEIIKISNNGKYLLLKDNKSNLITVYALEKKIKIANRIAKLSIDKYLHQGKLKIIDINEVEDKYNESFIREMFSTIKDSIDETDFDYSKDYIELKDYTLVQMERLIDEIITESDITNKRLYDYLGVTK